MGILDFLKGKKTAANDARSIEPNLFFLLQLRGRLAAMGYAPEKDPKVLSLHLGDGLEIAPVIIPNPNNHPMLMQVLLMTIQKTHFPDGIEDYLVGVGETLEQKVQAAIDNFLQITFPPIVEALSDRHDESIDFKSTNGGREVLWHPHPGPLAMQGKWGETVAGDAHVLLNLLWPLLPSVLTPDQKINTLKIYLSISQGEQPIIEAVLNNKLWEEANTLLQDHMRSWPLEREFLGVKQFMVFRRCDAYD